MWLRELGEPQGGAPTCCSRRIAHLGAGQVTNPLQMDQIKANLMPLVSSILRPGIRVGTRWMLTGIYRRKKRREECLVRHWASPLSLGKGEGMQNLYEECCHEFVFTQSACFCSGAELAPQILKLGVSDLLHFLNFQDGGHWFRHWFRVGRGSPRATGQCLAELREAFGPCPHLSPWFLIFSCLSQPVSLSVALFISLPV